MAEFIAILCKPGGEESFRQIAPHEDGLGFYRLSPHAFKVVKPGFYLKADLTPRHNGTIWVEEHDDPAKRSAVMTFGWCYKMGSGNNELTESEMAELVHLQRKNGTPNVDVLSGTYCLLSYDHVSESLWVCTDMWAQMGFYFGSNEDIAVAGSSAAEIADILNEKLDGISYLSHLRGTDFPPGRTLFANVWRATCGRALHLNLKNKIARVVQIQPLYHPPLRIGFKEAVERFIDVTSRVIPQAASDPSTCVDLTGGNDTRMSAAALAYAQGGKIGQQVLFRVTGSANHPDAVTAQRIADTFGWTLIRNDRDFPLDYSIESLQKAAILSDGKFNLSLILNRLIRETKFWETTGGLVGSLGGELFRDFNWRHELLNIGRTNRINYRAWLRHRLWASNDVDIKRVSAGRLNLEDHNEALIQPYRTVDQTLPDMKNVYKLDRFYHYKKMHSTWCWPISDLRKIILPFHCQEIARVSMAIPWHLRLGRRLITTGIQRMAPRLASIPTDKGAPMEPLRPGNFSNYINWLIADVRSNYARHFGKTKFTPIQQYQFTIAPFCLNIILNGSHARQLYETDSILNQAKHDGIVGLTKSQNDEIQALLLAEMILRNYPKINPELSFDGEDAKISQTSYAL